MRHGKNKKYLCRKKNLNNWSYRFRGIWLSRAILELGAEVYGIGLNEGIDKIFTLTNTKNDIVSYIQDIRYYTLTAKLIEDINPEVIFHLAAQPLVLESYKTPVQTFESNIMGTIHILEAAHYLTNP